MTRLQFAKYIEPLQVALFLAAMGWLAFEAYWLDNTIGGLHLFWRAFAAGCILGFTPAVAFGYFHNELLAGLVGPVVRVLRFAAFSAITFGLLSAAGASFVNRRLATEPIHGLTVVVTGKALGGKSHATPYIFFSPSPDSDERIEVDRYFYDQLSVGKEVVLKLQEGSLRYEVVLNWSATN